MQEHIRETKMERHRIRVAQLRAGDVMAGTGEVVIQRPLEGARTPAGRCEVMLERPDGRGAGARLSLWRKDTRVTVLRDAAL